MSVYLVVRITWSDMASKNYGSKNRPPTKIRDNEKTVLECATCHDKRRFCDAQGVVRGQVVNLFADKQNNM